MADKISLTPGQIQQSFGVLRDLIDVNDQPFRGQAKRLLYDLQTEIKYLQDASPEDIEAIQDREVEFGEKIVAPQHFPSEYEDTLKRLCNAVPKKESKLANIT